MKQGPKKTPKATRQYCPKCESFNIRRVHRGLINKFLLNGASQFQCDDCGTKLSEKVFTTNKLKRLPEFLGRGYTGSKSPF